MFRSLTRRSPRTQHTISRMNDLNPIQKLAALRLIAGSVSTAIAEATAEADQWRRQIGATQFRSDWGVVSVSDVKPKIAFSDEFLLSYAAEHAPHIIEPKVSAAKASWLARTMFAIDGDDVIELATGEVVPGECATVIPGTETISVRPTDEAKAHAAHVLGSRIQDIAPLLLLPEGQEDTRAGR